MSNKFTDKFITYFKGVKSEWGKVIWPEKPQVAANFFWVIIICTFFTLLIFGLDVAFDKILGLLPTVH